MKFAFYTLGCKVNQYETQAMERRILEMGHSLGSFDEVCDGYIVNTCTVTAVSDKKARNAIRRAQKLNPNAVVGVCGCYAQVSPEEVRALGPQVLIGTKDRMAFLDMLVASVQDRQVRENIQPALQNHEFEILPAGGLVERTRAMLKVEDGCNNFCSYCIIPYARGPVRSLPLENAVAEARRLEELGYKELVVTGIEISSWGLDFKDGSNLIHLLKALCEAVPKLRIRLGSLEPRTVTEEFCTVLKQYDNLCPQFHLSLQSGSDSVLKRMNRKYDTARYLQSVRLLREHFPHCAITTDVIVAFPNETEEEFKETLQFMDTCQFSACHIFPYSRRSGTPADKMSHQHNHATKESRAHEAGKVAERWEQEYLSSLLGTEQEVLWEQTEDGYFTGHAKNAVKVYIQGKNLENQCRICRIISLFRDGVLGEFS
ncbi:MAG: tRNA (N(6)-L-threonylcarbamoyladenosine(37)-C(2))-methylthiotransferase MtaB [Oscillospiraceae bacterium]|nr:tRNA (N(6)-L-threonylcarbamoyladenosine(37)-C(2))-methylthiotransferase MtaB [Oscillospiraceae bacterium]